VEENGQVTVYDTGEHQIGGVSQQQGGGSSLTFTSQYGTVRLADLPVVSGGGGGPSQTVPPVQSPRAAGGPTSPAQQGADEADIFAKIERLADLKKKGIVSEEEFLTKKAELLRRL
jgi:hypothetical protein